MDFWSSFAKLYDVAEALNGDVYHEMTRQTRILIPHGAKVLDCAAGTGALSIAAADRAQSVLCTDASKEMLSVAKKKANRRRLLNITFEVRNIFHLEDPDNTYDIAIAGNVLHLLVTPENAVKELCRVTKPGGRVLLPTFMLKDKSQISEKLIGIYKKLGFSPSTDYSPKSYTEMLKSCSCGEVKAKLIKGTVPCCYAMITVEK